MPSRGIHRMRSGGQSIEDRTKGKAGVDRVVLTTISGTDTYVIHRDIQIMRYWEIHPENLYSQTMQM